MKRFDIYSFSDVLKAHVDVVYNVLLVSWLQKCWKSNQMLNSQWLQVQQEQQAQHYGLRLKETEFDELRMTTCCHFRRRNWWFVFNKKDPLFLTLLRVWSGKSAMVIIVEEWSYIKTSTHLSFSRFHLFIVSYKWFTFIRKLAQINSSRRKIY